MHHVHEFLEAIDRWLTRPCTPTAEKLFVGIQGLFAASDGQR